MTNLYTYDQLKAKKAERNAYQYVSFTSIDEMDAATEAYLFDHDLKKSEHTILMHLSRHSVKAYGVSWGRIPYIAEMTELSERTVQRALARFESDGIIKRIPTTRENGGCDWNYIVIQPWAAVAVSDSDVEGIVEPVAVPVACVVAGNVTENVAGGKAREATPGKGLGAVFFGEASKAFKSSKSLKTKELKDDVNAYPRDVISEIVPNSKFNKYVINELVSYTVKMDVPLAIFTQLNKALLNKYNAAYGKFEAVNANDLVSSVWKAVDIFNNRFRNGHPISSYGAFFETIFTKEVNRRIIIRAQANKEDVYSLVS